jgi:predicted nucleic acid-binding protein
MVSSLLPSPTSVFIDTSVMFAASLSETGHARDLIVAGARGEFALVLSTFVIEELQRSLAAKAPRALPILDAFLALGVARVVDPPVELVRQVAGVVALKDAPIVAGAIHSEAPFLATYDRKHLLTQAAVIRDSFGIIVATPQTLLTAD